MCRYFMLTYHQPEDQHNVSGGYVTWFVRETEAMTCLKKLEKTTKPSEYDVMKLKQNTYKAGSVKPSFVILL